MLMKTDKALHFLWMFLIVQVLNNFTENILMKAVVIVVVALLKELYDVKIKKSKFDWLDVLATIAGGATAILI